MELEALVNKSLLKETVTDGGLDQLQLKDDYVTSETSLNVVGLCYTIKERPGPWWRLSCLRPHRKKKILNDISISFQQRELTALVGSSGAGKTSLLDIISGRVESGTTGVVTYRRRVCTQSYMRLCSSYVIQADRLLPTLTVKEMLTFMAYLKLPGNFTKVQIGQKVDDVIQDMGLRQVAETRLGGTVVRGVSGGEKRRVTIGIELLKDPEILLLDEPTSGLDAFTARHLVSSLSKLAHKGKMVVMSIHQPRSDIFNLLDKLAILTMGQLAFLGSPGQLVPYFTSIGYPCPLDRNPLDVYIDVTSVDSRNPVAERTSRATVTEICDAFSSSDLHPAILKSTVHSCMTTNHRQSTGTKKDSLGCKQGPSWLRTFFCILRRMNTHLYRDRSSWIGRVLFLPFFIPFFFIFTGRLKSNQASIQDRLGIIYQSAQVTPYMGLTNALALFPILRDVYYRESRDGLYSTFTFLLAYFVHILPYSFVSGILFASGLYWAIGLNDDLSSFGEFVALSVMLTQFGEMITVTFLGWFRDIQVVNVIAGLTIGSSSLFGSGLMRSLQTMPNILQWACYVSVHKYVTEMFVYNEFHGLEFECEHAGQPCFQTGRDFLQTFNPGIEDHTERNLIIVCAYFCSIWVVAGIVFKIRGIPTLH